MSTQRLLALLLLVWTAAFGSLSSSELPQSAVVMPGLPVMALPAGTTLPEFVTHRIPDHADRSRMQFPAPQRLHALKHPASPTSSPARPAVEVGLRGFQAWRTSAMTRCIRFHESTDNYRAVDPAGEHFGAYQFLLATWHGVGGVGNPIDASPLEQDYRAYLLWLRDGWSPQQWSTVPLCR